MLSLPQKKIIVVTTGRIHRAKGWPLLVNSFVFFLVRHPNAMLVFVGDGNDRSALEQAIVENGLKEHVLIVGQQSPEQLSIYLKAANLFVMGSEKEGWSTSLLEALGCCLPIVTTRFSV